MSISNLMWYVIGAGIVAFFMDDFVSLRIVIAIFTGLFIMNFVNYLIDKFGG